MADNGTPNTVQEIADVLELFNGSQFHAEVTVSAHSLLITVTHPVSDDQWAEMRVGVTLDQWTTAVPDLLKMNLDRVAAKMQESGGPREPDQPIDPWTGNPMEREG